MSSVGIHTLGQKDNVLGSTHSMPLLDLPMDIVSSNSRAFLCWLASMKSVALESAGGLLPWAFLSELDGAKDTQLI